MVSTPVRHQPSGLSESPLSLAQSAQSAKHANLGFAPILSSPLPTTPLFGTDGIRGKAGELLNADLALQVGFWAAQVLRQNAPNSGPIIIGQDPRNSSDMLAMALAAGITSAGLEVWHLGLCPTPCVANLTRLAGAVGGVMISASHNPPEDNGIKFFGSDGTKLPVELQQEIEAALRKTGNITPVAASWGKHYHRPSLVENYIESLKNSLEPSINLQGMRIVLDLGWGAAAQLAPKVFKEMGADAICLHDEPDGDRINVGCGSTHLDLLQEAVRTEGADLGFAFDGDADRVMAVDAQGRVVDGDYILYFWGKTLRHRDQLPGDLIVATVMANLGFERAWKQLGGKMIRTAVGDQYVQAEMLRHGGMLGGEQSGHILCRHYSVTGDGLLAALHIASLVKEAGVTLAELVDGSFQTYPQLLRNVRVEDRDRRRNWQQCDAVLRAIAQAEADMGDRGRVLVRASGTEPLIRVMVEAASDHLVKHWTEQLALAVEQHLVRA